MRSPRSSYDPRDYEGLQVSAEVKELFSLISRFTPQSIELEHRLRPYIPDYIPAVGDIDAFIKVRLQPYIPDYIPAVGDIDAFIKVRLRLYIPDYIPAVGDIDAFIKLCPTDKAKELRSFIGCCSSLRLSFR